MNEWWSKGVGRVFFYNLHILFYRKSVIILRGIGHRAYRGYRLGILSKPLFYCPILLTAVPLWVRLCRETYELLHVHTGSLRAASHEYVCALACFCFRFLYCILVCVACGADFPCVSFCLFRVVRCLLS